MNEPKQSKEPPQFAGTRPRSLVRWGFGVFDMKQLLNGSIPGTSERVNLVPRERITNDRITVQILILMH